MPDTLKQSIISLVLNVCPPQDIKSNLRPIALTSCLAKVLERPIITNKRLLGLLIHINMHSMHTLIDLFLPLLLDTNLLIQETAVFGYFFADFT